MSGHRYLFAQRSAASCAGAAPGAGGAPVLLALSCALIVSVLHAYFREHAPILAAALLPWFFLTPILFSPATIPYVDSHPFVGTLLDWGVSRSSPLRSAAGPPARTARGRW